MNLISVMIASGIGITIMLGTSQYLIDLTGRISQLEIRQEISFAKQYWNTLFNSSENCTKMLQGKLAKVNEEIALVNPMNTNEVLLQKGMKFKGYYIDSVRFTEFTNDPTQSESTTGNLLIQVKQVLPNGWKKTIHLNLAIQLNFQNNGSITIVDCEKRDTTIGEISGGNAGGNNE